jgi:hypothetical protein
MAFFTASGAKPYAASSRAARCKKARSDTGDQVSPIHITAKLKIEFDRPDLGLPFQIKY